MKFLMGLILGYFVFWAIGAVTNPPATDGLIYWLGGMACGIISTSIICYVFMDRLCQSIFGVVYRPYRPAAAPMAELEDEAADDHIVDAEDDEDDWLTDPDFWKKGKKRG